MSKRFSKCLIVSWKAAAAAGAFSARFKASEAALKPPEPKRYKRRDTKTLLSVKVWLISLPFFLSLKWNLMLDAVPDKLTHVWSTSMRLRQKVSIGLPPVLLCSSIHSCRAHGQWLRQQRTQPKQHTDTHSAYPRISKHSVLMYCKLWEADASCALSHKCLVALPSLSCEERFPPATSAFGWFCILMCLHVPGRKNWLLDVVRVASSLFRDDIELSCRNHRKHLSSNQHGSRSCLSSFSSTSSQHVKGP